jgi:hypothetical protein
MERSRKEAILRKEMELLPDSACSESSADEYAVPTMASVKESIRKRRESRYGSNDHNETASANHLAETNKHNPNGSDRKTIEMKKRGKGQITVLPDQFHGSAIERTDLDAAAPAQLSQCMVVCEIQDPRTQTIIERQSSRSVHTRTRTPWHTLARLHHHPGTLTPPPWHAYTVARFHPGTRYTTTLARLHHHPSTLTSPMRNANKKSHPPQFRTSTIQPVTILSAQAEAAAAAVAAAKKHAR